MKGNKKEQLTNVSWRVSLVFILRSLTVEQDLASLQVASAFKKDAYFCLELVVLLDSAVLVIKL